MKIVDSNIYTINTTKTFLTLLNYLDITKVSGDTKKALKSYEDAKKILENYLSLSVL